MDRILRDTQAKVYVTLTDASGAAADTSTGLPTVTAVRDSDGTTAATGSAVDEAGTGLYSFTLTPSQIPEVDLLNLTWTATVGGVASQLFRTQVDVVGGWLCSLEAIAASMPTATKTTAELQAARIWAEDWLERACGVAFRPRYRRETLSGRGQTDLLIGQPQPSSILAATVSDTALTSGELADLTLDPIGFIYASGGWESGRENISVAYVHGFDTVPAPVTRAAVKLARHYLLDDPTNLDERATSVTTEDATYSFVTAGVGGARSSIPEVNQVIDEYRFVSV